MVDADVFTQHRRLLFAIAYRMTGSVADAEDLVQEAWLRWAAVQASTVEQPKAYLVRTITNLSVNQLTSARARRESYVGPWLPEPLLTQCDPSEGAEVAEAVEMAMLIVLETLSPLERAVFLLHDVFGYSHAEIASIVDKPPTAVRHIAVRARAHVAARRPRFETDVGVRRQAVQRFRQACTGGDLNAMMELLAPDVVAWADGGGKVSAARRPLVGADHVARWILAVTSMPQAQGVRLEVAEINAAPALLATAGEQPIGMINIDVAAGLITAVRFVVNPDKLKGLLRR